MVKNVGSRNVGVVSSNTARFTITRKSVTRAWNNHLIKAYNPTKTYSEHCIWLPLREGSSLLLYKKCYWLWRWCEVAPNNNESEAVSSKQNQPISVVSNPLSLDENPSKLRIWSFLQILCTLLRAICSKCDKTWPFFRRKQNSRQINETWVCLNVGLKIHCEMIEATKWLCEIRVLQCTC